MGQTFTVTRIVREEVAKVRGNPEFNQDPDELYFPPQYPRGVREVEVTTTIRW